MLGDVVGMPGVLAVEQQMGRLRQQWRPNLVIANAENAHQGSGLTPKLYQRLIAAGVDAITLGDHVYKRMAISSVLEHSDNIVRPANLPRVAKGRTWMRLQPQAANNDDPAIGQSATQALPPVYVMLVLGRVFPTLAANDPFATVSAALTDLPDADPIVIVEVHGEATSEKQAVARHFDGQVAAVIGSHTHVPTADAQILPGGTAYMTDMGMCGPHESIIGRRIDRVLKFMTTSMPTPFDVAEGDPRVNGVVMDIDTTTKRAVHIERVELPADVHAPPFVAAGA